MHFQWMQCTMVCISTQSERLCFQNNSCICISHWNLSHKHSNSNLYSDNNQHSEQSIPCMYYLHSSHKKMDLQTMLNSKIYWEQAFHLNFLYPKQGQINIISMKEINEIWFQFLKKSLVNVVLLYFCYMLRWMEAIPSVIRAFSTIEAVLLYSTSILIVIHALWNWLCNVILQ